MSTDQKKTKRRLGIGTRLIIGVCIFGIVLGIVASAIGYSRFTKVIERRYNENAYEIAYTAGSYINGDRLREYAQTLEKDEEYDITQAMLDELCENTNTTTIYVALAHPEDWCTLTYVYDSIHSSTGWSRYELGYVDEHAILPDFTWVIQDIIEQNNIHKDTYIYTYNLASGDHTNVIVPVLDSSGEIVGIIGVEKAMTALNEARVSYVKSVLFYTFTTLVLFILVYIWILNRQIIKPVLTVKNEAQAFVQQDAQVSTVLNTIESGDEVGDLAQAVYQMELDIRSYITNLTAVTAEKERIGAELDVAKHIQVSMLPSIFPSFPDRDEFDVYATMTPAKEVGGDFYDFFLIDDDHLAMVMADVSGKGIPAAMFMMISKTLIKSAAQSGLSPKAVLEKVNNQLCENNDAEMFVTVWIGIMQISTGKTVCANAGHEYPAIMRASGEFELFKDRHGFVLAGMEGARYREYELELNPGDRLFVYTDGVAEATNAQNELFGTDRMIDALNKYKDGTCSDILHGVKAEIDGFVLEAPQFDDITMLCLTLTPPANDGRVTMTMEPSLENIEKATAFLREGLESAEAPKRVISQVSIVIDEILSNVANYSGATEASVSYTTDERKISMQFVDNGNPYDPTSAPEPDITLAAEDREIGGLGIFIVKKTMDTVSYINEGGKNILTIEKSW